MYKMLLLIALVTAASAKSADPTLKCVQDCAAPYFDQLEELNARFAYSLRLPQLDKVCDAYRPTIDCAVECKPLSTTAENWYASQLDMDVPCDVKFHDKFKEHGKCIGAVMLHHYQRCRGDCGRNATNLSKHSDSLAFVPKDNKSARKQLRRLISECYKSQCTNECIEREIERDDKNCPEDATTAAELYTEWTRDTLVSTHVRRHEQKLKERQENNKSKLMRDQPTPVSYSEPPDKWMPAECEWSVKSSETFAKYDAQSTNAAAAASTTAGAIALALGLVSVLVFVRR